MKKIIIFISILSFLIVGIIYSINYNNVKNVESYQNTQDEDSLISCFEYPLKTPNEKMIMIINHKNFKFSKLKNLNSYIHFVGLLMGEYGECNMTLNCKKEFSNKITNFKEYLEPIVEQCKIIIDNECKEIKKPLRRGFFINDLQIRYFVYNENNQLIGEYDNSFFNNSFSFK